MLPIFRARKNTGWMAVVPRERRIDLAYVLRQAGGRPEIRRLESFQIDIDAAGALSHLRTACKLKSFHCTTLLPAGRYQFLQMEAPEGPVQERRQVLRWRLKDVVDFAVDQASIDVIDIPMESPGIGRQAAVFVAVAAADVVEAQMNVFADAKIPLEVIDLPEIAQRNVAALFEESNRGLAFLALDETGGLLTLTYRGELFACRRIDVSAVQLAQVDPERHQQLLDRLALELQRSLDTFDRQFGFISIARLLVASTPAVENLQSVLAENLYVPVQLMDLSEVIDFPTIPELGDTVRQAQCLTTIGAALRESP